jgi:hypothetical protein
VYLDTANHFSISIPTGWIVEPRLGDQNNGLSVRLSGISEGGIIPSFHVSITSYENTTLEKYYKSYCRPFDSPDEDREIIQEGNYNKNGIFYKWIQTKTKPFGIRSLIYYCYNKGSIYAISYAGDPTNFEKYIEPFKKAVDTFKL